MEIGNTVKLIQPVIQGEILDTEYDKSSKELRHLVSWVEGEETYQRWFVESQLEVV